MPLSTYSISIRTFSSWIIAVKVPVAIFRAGSTSTAFISVSVLSHTVHIGSNGTV